MQTRTTSSAPLAASRRVLLTALGLVAAWGLLLWRFGPRGDIYAVLGPFALAVSALVGALSRNELRSWLHPTHRAVISGIGVGVAMTALTYPTYAAMRSLVPALDAEVASLYASAHPASLATALPWVLAIVLAEELLWRGALIEALASHVAQPLAMAISVATYAAAQVGSGWVVVLLAFACGSAWTLQRMLTGSLLSPLITHLIWTPVVILFYPVTSL